MTLQPLLVFTPETQRKVHATHGTQVKIMLQSLTRRRDQAAAQKAEEHFRKGLDFLDAKLSKQAMIEFQKAVKLDPNGISERIQSEFNHYNSQGDYEAALSLGLILIKFKPGDFALANNLGNCARRQKSYKQANSLYRHALKVNKNYKTAFYNLAASMGKVDKYDDEVVDCMCQFAKVDKFILPDYMNNPNVEEEIKAECTLVKQTEVQNRLELLSMELQKHEMEGNYVEVERIEFELKHLNSLDPSPTPEEMYKRFQELIDASKGFTNEREHRAHLGDIFNYGLYALIGGDPEIAMDCFSDLKKQNCDFEYLDMVIAICDYEQGREQEAVDCFVRLLGKDPYNRYYNVNLGIMYRQQGNSLLSAKYLVVGAWLLEKSDGLYRLSDLLRIAEDSLTGGNVKKALKLYRVIATEVSNPDIFVRIGQIHLEAQKLDEAADAFKTALEKDPEYGPAQEKLREVHNVLAHRAEVFFRDTKYKAAAGMFEKALKIMREPETLKSAASAYKVLRNSKRYDELMEEYEREMKKRQDLENEKTRQAYIIKGKAWMQRKEFHKAIEQFELAFRMKLDKDVFMFLAHLYKGMKQHEAMRDLLSRYNRMVEQEERRKAFEKDEERAKASQQ